MKLDRLFQKARLDAPPHPTPGFERRVLRALRNEAPASEVSLFDQLSSLFPRLALASALVIALCCGIELLGSDSAQPDLTSGLVQLSDQWLFTAKGF
jgi:hypothetical protein